MESKRIQWNKLLNYLLISISIIMVGLFIGLCFVPVTNANKAKALTKDDIRSSAYNIHFNSAKTRIRTSESYYKTRLNGKSGYFNTYQYSYKDNVNEQKLYLASDSSGNLQQYSSSVGGNVQLTTNESNGQILFDKYSSTRYHEYIPNGTTHYLTEDNKYEEIFYDEIDDGDFVLIDNYNNHNTAEDSFNVENFYLSFGTPYLDDVISTTPLHYLQIEATLINSDNVKHNIVLDTYDPIEYTNKVDGHEHLVYYWYQYFDLRNLRGYTTNEAEDTYAIENQQGKYEFTFTFIKYTVASNGDLSVTVNSEDTETFKYSFYLLDSTNYSNIPTINNATLGSLENNEAREYFYNFNTDHPYVSYNPENFNISYKRENRDIIDNITSTYTTGSYLNQSNSRRYPKSVITYNNGANEEKQVFILTNYNEDKTFVEYLYLADINNSFTESAGTYDEYRSALEAGTLKFEYKLTKILTQDGSKYTTTTYRTNDYSQRLLNTAIDSTNQDKYTVVSTDYIKVSGGDYYYSHNGQEANEKKVATITMSQIVLDDSDKINTLASGMFIDITNLDTTATELSENVFNYKLVVNNTNKSAIIEKTYFDADAADNKKTIEIPLSTTTTTSSNQWLEVNDPIHTYISIRYQVNNEQNITNIVIQRNVYNTSGLNANLTILDRILRPEEIYMEMSYDLSFDNLGIYTFDYKYNVLADQTYTNDQHTSTNILAIKDYNLEFGSSTSDLTATSEDLILKTSGYFDKENKLILNGREFIYDNAKNTLTIDGSLVTLTANIYEQNITTPYVMNLNNLMVPAKYGVSQDSNGSFKLTISYTIGKVKVTPVNSNKFNTVEYIDNNAAIPTEKSKIYVNNYTTNSTRVYSLGINGAGKDLNGNDITSITGSTPEWSNIYTLIQFLASNATSNINTYHTSSPNLNSAILHVFGSITYFNKDDVSTDSEYAKLELVDNKTEKNYISDVTKYHIANGKPASYNETIKSEINPLMGFSKDIIITDSEDGKKGIEAQNLIITDITPVFWKNFSTLLYSDKVSNSYIYRYPNYIKTGSYDNPEISKYTKDTYVQFDGLYEIVVFYTYDNYKSLDNSSSPVFYQLFTFIIDNSSPKLTVKVADEEGNFTQDLGLNKYTNKNMELSWNKPTYFQNDIYIDINKTGYGTDTNNFTAIYRNGRKTTTSGDSSVTTFVESSDTDKQYRVLITGNANGNYKVTLHYSSRGESTVTEEFIIDKQNITGLKTLPVVQKSDGTYVLNDLYDPNYLKNNKSQIVNFDFTFRYLPKASGAKIFTYWYKIDFEKATASEYDKLLTLTNDESAITTTYKVNGINLQDISLGNQYVYNTNNYTSNSVNNANYFSNDNSAIYLFKMVDEAGNECRYVVFYDTTAPRFLMEPTPTNPNNIVNDSTKITWGNYKAILIDTANDYEINLSESLDDYKLNYDKTKTKDNLQESLIYIKSSNQFNDAQIQLIDGKYYLLLPIESATIQDLNSLQTEDSKPYIKYEDNLPTEYYFFPTNPVDEENKTITLPVYDDDSRSYIKEDFAIDSFSYTQLKNSDLELFNRFVTTKNIDVYGAFGQGQYNYQVSDGLGNYTPGYLWMNLDKTQTMAYGIFNTNSDDISKAQGLAGEEGSYSAAKLYISSLDESETVPEYSLTYKFYELNSQLYETINNDHNLNSVKILTAANNGEIEGLTIVDKQTYLQLNFVPKNLNNVEANINKRVYIELTDESGNESPKHSYPYDLEGMVVVSDNLGNPEHIYKNNKSSLTNNEGSEKRLFSTIINPTADAEGNGNIVTQEGLYIFKRVYANDDIDLGSDQKIIYRIYYVDRTGIINVTTLNSIAEKLSEAQDFGFVLGSDYTGNNASLKTYINSDDIKNDQSPNKLNPTDSNTRNSAYNLFKTNKTLLQFNLTADKYNFNAFNQAFSNKFTSKFTSNDTDEQAILNRYLETKLFNDAYYSQKMYKINLTLKRDASLSIIDESNMDIDARFNQAAMDALLKGYVSNNGFRSNSYNLFMANNYNVMLIDNSGYRVIENGVLLENNRLANELDLSFDINHKAPVADTYGKDYSKDYDEHDSTGNSIPLDENNNYNLLKEYLVKRKLEHLSLNYKENNQSTDGNYVKLYSTNNETLIFTFSINPDDYQAKIDPNNIRVYKGSVNANNIIFERGYNTSTKAYDFIESNLVSKERMQRAFIMNEIDGVQHYAIIVFDNNLDEILDTDESDYLNFRLLDKDQNPDKENYYITLNYIGDPTNYIDSDNNSYASTTYEITIDRYKPMYNLTKLMSLDKYVYNEVSTTPTQENYEAIFEQYKKYYQFSTDEAYDFERSYLENYFFALDYRENTSFVFESASELDSNNGIYIRHVNKDAYKFSVTPDDYKAYKTSEYLQGHPLFTSSRANRVTLFDITQHKLDLAASTSEYFYIPFGLFNDDPNIKNITASDLVKNLLVKDNYYEIIECDEAGNYRVYAVYIPDYASTRINYEYRMNQSTLAQNGTITYDSNTIISVNGIEFNLINYNTLDRFIKANIEVNSTKLKETISIIYEPNDKRIYVRNNKNLNIDIIEKVTVDSYKNEFVTAINKLIQDYTNKITSKNSSYYTQYGFSIKVKIIDRIGVQTNIVNDNLYDYEIIYNVAGSILSPIFKDGANSFTITVPEKTGSTYIKNIKAYIFRSGWSLKDPDDKLNSFAKSEEELMKGFTYTLSKGVYKFVIIDNFERENVYFYEFGTSTTQAGGNLKFSNKYSTYTDGYTYTSNYVDFIYDNNLYDIYIQFIGETLEDDVIYNDNDLNPHIIYSNDRVYTETDLSPYGITVSTIDNTTTVTFLGVTDLTKYHIKTIPAGISAQYEYKWGDELNNSNILVYDKKVAIYKGIPDVIIKNLNGNELGGAGEHLHLTEDFEVAISWKNIDFDTQIDFNSKIVLVRTYTENNVVKTETLSNANSYIITKPGEYTAYVINSLNNTSNAITFTRGEGEISMYSVFNVDRNNKLESQLIPSSKVDNEEYSTAEETRNIIVFNYFSTVDYFSFKDLEGRKLTIADLDEGDITEFTIDKTSNKYLDVRVNSNLSIFVDLFKLSKEGSSPYAEFRIYSKNSANEVYTYRFIKIYFLNNTNYNLATTSITTTTDPDNIYNGNNPVIKRPDKALIVKFKFIDTENNSIQYTEGNTLFVDRYYGDELIETLTFNSITQSTMAVFELTQVGLHKFVVRDLAGRQQVFGTNDDNTTSKMLKIYLINQILFTVNNESPINNQIFNGEVTINILSELSGLTLYNTKTLGISVTKNGAEIATPNSTEISFSEQGYYTVKMVATTVLSDENSNIADQEIITLYNFVIIRTDIALNSFNVSKGSGFLIDKLVKIVNNERHDITHSYECKDSLLWLSHDKEGNSIFEVTLKYYDTNIKDYRRFTFNVWINADAPVIISNIPNGTSTKEVITLDFNPGMIYSQVGKCKILINDQVYLEINEESQRVSNTISITDKGTYYVKIVADDGTLISSYKYIKADPMNKTTQIVLICVAIGVVILVAIFFLVRRKGKYR